MFGFLKKKEVKEQSKFCEATLTRAVELIAEHTMFLFKFIEGVDVLEKKMVSEDRPMAKLLIKHKNGTSVEVSTEEYVHYFANELQEAIEKAVTDTWPFEFEELLSTIKKSCQAIGEFDKYKCTNNMVEITYLGTRYQMSIGEVIRFDEKLKETKLNPIYDRVRLIELGCPFSNSYARSSMNIYQIAIWWIAIHK